MLVIADETQCVGRLVDNPNYFHVQVHLCNDMQGDCIPHLKLDGREWTFVMYRYVMMLQLDWIGVYEYVSRYSGRILVKSSLESLDADGRWTDDHTHLPLLFPSVELLS